MWKDFYKDIVLTEEEKEAALLEGRIAKYFREKNKEYWEDAEKINNGKAEVLREKIGKL